MAAWTRVDLPVDVTEPFDVFVNGVLQREGADFERRAGALLFSRPLVHEGRLGAMRWLSMLLGIAGTYRQNDSVDVVYERAGRRVVATALPLHLVD